MPKTSLVLTVLGADRPGLVEAIARVVAEHEANWLESRMAHLAGQFAGILRVEVEQVNAESLAAALRAVDADDGGCGLDTIIRPDDTTAVDADLPTLLLDVTGADRSGIVREISRVLASQGVNVEELATETLLAANTGHPVFHAAAKLRVPAGADEKGLREALEAVAADLVVEVTLAAERDS